MSRVRSKDTGPELVVRKRLHRAGFRYRLHDKSLPGTPDIVLKRYNAVIFVNGCFWHGHACGRSSTPKSNSDFWQAKFEKNRERDVKNNKKLRKMGWRVSVVWQCGLRNHREVERTMSVLIKWLRSTKPALEIPRIVNG